MANSQKNQRGDNRERYAEAGRKGGFTGSNKGNSLRSFAAMNDEYDEEERVFSSKNGRGAYPRARGAAAPNWEEDLGYRRKSDRASGGR